MTLPSIAERSERPGIWQQALSSALRVEWERAEPLSALRCVAGVGIPLAVALLMNQPAAGMFTAIGSVSAGFGSFQGAYRSRAATMLFAAGGMAFSLFAGSLAGHSLLVATVVAALAGFTAGLLVSLGPAAGFVALQSAVAALVASDHPAANLGDAATRGLLVLAGGLFQTLLVVSLWPLRRFSAERQVIADVYESLAGYADALSKSESMPVPPEPHTLTGVSALHKDPQPFARSSELLVFRGLLDEAERIRASLTALSLSVSRHEAGLPDRLAAVLREIAAAVREGRAPAIPGAAWDALDAAAANRGGGGAIVDSLVAQVRSAYRMASVPAIDDEMAAATVVRARTIPPVRNALMTIKANLSPRSTAFRHAVRLASAMALATVAYRWAELPRGYWIPMTALLVLKPEYRETFVTGITRILGTLVGAGLATLLVERIGSNPAEVTALLLVFVWSGYTLFRANYTAFTVCITGYIVLLLYLANIPGPDTARYRAIDTMLGGVLALVIYRAWPTWEAQRLREVLATEAEALARDSDAMLGMYVDPATWDSKVLQQSRAAARLARSNAEASVERTLGEPPARDGLDGELGLSLLAGFRRYALGALALHARLDRRPVRPSPELAPLRDRIVANLRAVAAALRDGGSPQPLPAVAETLSRVRPAIDPAVAEEMELLVESVNTIAALLRAERASASRAF